MKLGVIGHGVVGKHMQADCQRAGVEPVVYDKFQPGYSGIAIQMGINACDAVFVCVSTPEAPDGAVDLSAIWDVFSWLKVPVAIIRSTVIPGTTDRLVGEGHRVVFCPEFIGEGVNPPYLAMRQPPWLILGGEPADRALAAQAFARLYNAECGIISVSAKAAEVAKYGENFFLALKVTWANEMYDICEQLGVNYVEMMGALSNDHRIGRSHTQVFVDNRGWGGRCLPKDTAALLTEVGPEIAPLLAAMRAVNEHHRAESQ